MSNGWVGLHIHHQGNLDHLLVDGVAPLVKRLQHEGELERWFFLRYWDGGPHLRLRLLPRHRGDPDAAVLSTARRSMGDWLTHNPSTTRLDADEYSERARILAAQEGFERPPLPLCPNDTVETVPYRPEHGVFGTGHALAAAEAHFEESSALALSVLNRTHQGGSRARTAFFLLMIALAGSPCRSRTLSRWLRTSWEDWRASTTAELPPAVGMRADASLLDQAERLWHAARSPGSLDSGDGLGMWARSLARLRAAHSGPSTEAGARAASPFLPHGGPGPEGAPDLPLLLRCTHLFNNRTGLTGDAEGALFALACEALENIAAKNGDRDE
ncbi:thiopeptide-type bacteriocin biosynthesis protein [Nocardiopsis xinjiangensis]|uniref:thiopeptide-type bacteriocin biosynthesis protein n=1 Tax=Nocardiopsis xinjiangensis TaxID=124285 RepID=UPI00036D84E1|nr:thiopeptide-type bacteriocin biosynthesis protein [Nocardiopsis xinjiangensis]